MEACGVLAIIFLLLGIIIFFIGVFDYNFNESERRGCSLIGSWVVIVGLILLCINVSLSFSRDGYKQGQIDAIEGKLEYKKQIITIQLDTTITKVDSVYVLIKQ